ncbi:MAG: hypothetical protein JWR69_2583 [Pedosphaera sp.]|nr:hypothetical protein [Pedosphaera sp.]
MWKAELAAPPRVGFASGWRHGCKLFPFIAGTVCGPVVVVKDGTAQAKPPVMPNRARVPSNHDEHPRTPKPPKCWFTRECSRKYRAKHPAAHQLTRARTGAKFGASRGRTKYLHWLAQFGPAGRAHAPQESSQTGEREVGRERKVLPITPSVHAGVGRQTIARRVLRL